MTNKRAIFIISIMMLIGALCYTLGMLFFGIMVNLIQLGFIWYIVKFGETPENTKNPLDSIGKN